MVAAEPPVVVLVNCTDNGEQPPGLSMVKLACNWAVAKKGVQKIKSKKQRTAVGIGFTGIVGVES